MYKFVINSLKENGIELQYYSCKCKSDANWHDTYYTIVCLTCTTEFTDIYTVISFMKANNWDCGESLENEVHPKFTKIIEQETQKIVSTSINNETKSDVSNLKDFIQKFESSNEYLSLVCHRCTSSSFTVES